MIILQVEQTEQGTIVKIHDNREVARMYLTADDRDKRKLHLEVKDTGTDTMDLVMAVFKYARSMGEYRCSPRRLLSCSIHRSTPEGTGDRQ